VLLVSDVFEFSWRYLLPALVTLIPAGALGVATLASRPRSGHRFPVQESGGAEVYHRPHG
jgi:hypothetical protein